MKITADEILAKRAKEGDDSALAELIERYKRKLEPFAIRYFNKRPDARDLARDALSESFIIVWKNISRFDPKKASFSTWIHAITENVCLTILDSKYPHATHSLADKDVLAHLDREEGKFFTLENALGIDDYSFPISTDDFCETYKDPTVDPKLKEKNRKILERMKRWEAWRDGPGVSFLDRDWVGKSDPGEKLSAREETIRFELTARTPRKEIARKLKITEKTLAVAISRIKKKNKGNM